MTKILKANVTAEEWADHLAKRRAYTAQDKSKAARKALDASPDAVARRAAYHLKPENKARAKERYRKRAERDPDYVRRRVERSRVWRSGFDDKTIAALIAKQENKCAICGADFSRRRMVGDHCHATGRPRGLLCHHCNIIEGMLVHVGLDPLEYVCRLDAYLRNPPAFSL